MHFSNVVQSLKLQIPRRLHEIDSILFVNYGDIHSFDLGFIHIHPSPEWHRTYHVFRVKKTEIFILFVRAGIYTLHVDRYEM